MMQGFLHEEGSFGVFVLVTIILGGGAAALAGRAIAQTWRPAWQMAVYALFSAPQCASSIQPVGGTLLSAHYYLIDSAVCAAFGLTGFRLARVAQMVTQYRWINESDGPLRWRGKPQ